MKLKIGLIGLGHLGKIHLNDVDIEIAKELSAQYQIPAYISYETLLDDIDAIVIVTPTTTHFELAKRAIEKGKHCFIEKPVTSTLEEANALIALQEKYGVKVQVGHVERFNPAFLAASPYIKNPKFIEAHRLSMFKPRGTDVSVVHDLMIHDLDLISFIAKSELKEIRASGVAIVSPTADICNARIEYKNGLVANVTASRISLKTMRKIRIFQEDAYMSLDFQSKESEIFTLNETYQENSFELETYKGNRYISQIAIDTNSVNAILEEIKSFSKSIVTNTETEVNLKDGTRALELVDIILKQIER